MAVAAEADYMPPTHISAKAYEILLRIKQGLPIDPRDFDLLLSVTETSLILSLRRGGREVTPNYIYQLKHKGKLIPEVEGPPRYRLETVLNYTFHPKGPKPKSRHIG